MRTSRAIYEETFPIMYGKNRFVFSAASQISIFAFGELCRLFERPSLSDPSGLSLERYVHVFQCSFFPFVTKPKVAWRVPVGKRSLYFPDLSPGSAYSL